MRNFHFACTAICNGVLLLFLQTGSAFYLESFAQEDLTIDAGDLGKIRGVASSTIGSSTRPYVSFNGMRYAEAPTASRRFLPSTRSTGKLNATGDVYYAQTAGPSCSQPNSLLPVVQSEDCLFVNVHSPNLTGSLPVIFFIHGGAFTSGQGSLYTGKRLLNRNVVLVNMNYRLGCLGFFSLQTEDAPGNAGLYDIINALKWTNDFIKYFGGDPNKITIAGQSAGSVAVTHLLAIPEARGLFHGAIGVSGTALAAWGTTEDPISESLRVAELSNCYNPEDGYPDEPKKAAITSCMRNVTPDKLVDSLYKFQVEERQQGRLGFAVVSPVVQSFNISPGSNLTKLLTKHPKDVFESGEQADVPLMMGSTRHDGSYVLGVFYNRFLKDNNYVNATGSDRDFMMNHAVPSILRALGIPDEYGVYDSIAKMYLGDSRKSGDFWQLYPGLIDLFSVFFFKASSYQTALYHSALNSQTYWYSFDFQGTQTLFGALFGLERPPIQAGITHGDDLIYLFQVTFLEFTDDEMAVSNRAVDYWANFATFSNPTANMPSNQQWPPLTMDEANFLSIGKESTQLQYYDDTWSDIGWEVIPGDPTTTQPSTMTPSQPTTLPSEGPTASNPVTSPTTTSSSGNATGSSTTQPTATPPGSTVSDPTATSPGSTVSDPTTTPSGSGEMFVASKYLISLFLFVNFFRFY